MKSTPIICGLNIFCYIARPKRVLTSHHSNRATMPEPRLPNPHPPSFNAIYKFIN